MMEEDAKVYRERAVQARLGAKEATRADFRAAFERLAASYEEMARNAEWLAPQHENSLPR
jgi:molybdenum-dependent DNA-binding transcriptional regulator ModE